MGDITHYRPRLFTRNIFAMSSSSHGRKLKDFGSYRKVVETSRVLPNTFKHCEYRGWLAQPRLGTLVLPCNTRRAVLVPILESEEDFEAALRAFSMRFLSKATTETLEYVNEMSNAQTISRPSRSP